MKGKTLPLVAGAFCILGLVAVGLFFLVTYEDKAQEQKQKEAELSVTMDKLYNAGKEQIFLGIHPMGTATNITINKVTISQWFGGKPSGDMQDKDVQQFVVHFTIYWTSPFHPGDGVTEADDFYLRSSPADNFAFMRRANIKTNGTTTNDLGSLVMKGVMSRLLDLH